MANLRELNLSLLDWETRYIIESISKEMARLKTISEKSENEDEASDAGNDYLEIYGLKERLEKEAKATFGDQIVNFSRESI